jgi:hypothetical protein
VFCTYITPHGPGSVARSSERVARALGRDERRIIDEAIEADVDDEMKADRSKVVVADNQVHEPAPFRIYADRGKSGFEPVKEISGYELIPSSTSNDELACVHIRKQSI